MRLDSSSAAYQHAEAKARKTGRPYVVIFIRGDGYYVYRTTMKRQRAMHRGCVVLPPKN